MSQAQAEKDAAAERAAREEAEAARDKAEAALEEVEARVKRIQAEKERNAKELARHAREEAEAKAAQDSLESMISRARQCDQLPQATPFGQY